jgi:hypothetical protein
MKEENLERTCITNNLSNLSFTPRMLISCLLSHLKGYHQHKCFYTKTRWYHPLHFLCNIHVSFMNLYVDTHSRLFYPHATDFPFYYGNKMILLL